MNQDRFKSTIDNALRALQDVVQSGYIAESAEDFNPWRKRYESLVQELRNFRDDCAELYEEAKVESLSANMIESEGALRAAIAACSIIERVESWYSTGTIGKTTG